MVLNTHLKEPMTNYLKGISMDNVMDIINSPSHRIFNSNYINSLQHAKKNKMTHVSSIISSPKYANTIRMELSHFPSNLS